MNIEQLRHALKVKWLLYYRQHRPWLIKLGIWTTFEGQRRPSSSFILAALSTLEPQLIEMLPLIVALSNDPDQIVTALGLNFNPEAELKSLTQAPPVIAINTNGNGSPLASSVTETSTNGNGLAKPTLSNGKKAESLSPASQASNLPSWIDESCKGIGGIRGVNFD